MNSHNIALQHGRALGSDEWTGRSCKRSLSPAEPISTHAIDVIFGKKTVHQDLTIVSSASYSFDSL